MFRSGSVIAMLVIGGAAIGVNLEVRVGEALAMSIAAASLGLAIDMRVARRLFGCLALVAGMAAWGASARDRALAPPLLAWFDDATRGGRGSEGPTLVTGTLAADAVPAAAGVRLSIDVDAVRQNGVWIVAPGRLQAHVAGAMAPGRMRDWTKGRHIRAPVTVRRQPVLANFGGPSPRRQALRRPYVLGGSIKSGAVVEVDRAAWESEWAAALRRRVRSASARFIEPRAPKAAAIVTAILIGDRAGLSDDVERRLQEAGTYHVIAISGGNVALLTAMCFAGARLLIRSARVVALVTIVAVAIYGWVVGADASVARAVAAAALYLALGVAGLRPPPLAVLRAAAIALVAIDPLTVLDIGAWLSFAATLGIVSYGPPGPRALLGAPAGDCSCRARVMAGLVIATIAAEAVLLPVTVSAFSRISLAGVVLNLVAIPAMAAVQIAGFVVVCFAGVWPHLASGAGTIATLAARVLLTSCRSSIGGRGFRGGCRLPVPHGRRRITSRFSAPPLRHPAGCARSRSVRARSASPSSSPRRSCPRRNPPAIGYGSP
jgi:competence protein ComEC